MPDQTTLRPVLFLSAALLVAPGIATTADARQEATPEAPPRPGPAATAPPAGSPPPSPRPRAALPAPPAPRQGYLGVTLEDVTLEDVERLGLPEQRGALVTEVVEGSPADSSGLRAGDVVVEWRDEPVYSAAELGRLVRETPPGRRLEVGVFRDGSRVTLRVTLRERHGSAASFAGSGMGLRGVIPPEARSRIRERLDRAREEWDHARGRMEHPGTPLAAPGWEWDDAADSASIRHFRFAPMFAGDRPRLGVRLQSLTPQLAEYFGLGDRRGALVASVRDDSPADRAGLQAGDVLLSVAGEELSGVGDAVRSVRSSEGEVEIRVLRRGEERTVTVRLRAPGESGDEADDPGQR